MWGGREGYDTLLNTDLVRERDQLARFLHMVVDHAHKIGFKGSLLIEPKPQEPTKHQYDYDVATVHGFLLQCGLEKEIRVNIEANHAYACRPLVSSRDRDGLCARYFRQRRRQSRRPAKRLDTDQFPNSVEELTLAFYEILGHGGFTTGGMNFDSKVRRQSVDPEDLFYGHVGAIDNLALAVERAAVLIENDRLGQFKRERYAGWDADFGRKILSGDYSLSTLAADALSRDLNPQHASGHQERMENIVNQAIYSGR